MRIIDLTFQILRGLALAAAAGLGLWHAEAGAGAWIGAGLFAVAAMVVLLFTELLAKLIYRLFRRAETA
jgi:hypothetical protein